MKYQKTQQFLSGVLIFSLLFSITFRIPSFSLTTFAGGDSFYNLVSILVEEDLYDEIEYELERYAKDISGVLEGAKVVILPTKKDTTAFEIASLNESLYFDGYKSIDSVDFDSKLIGTVLIGDFDLPIIYSGEESIKSILPFVDFEDKAYVYDHVSKKYQKRNSINTGKPEIWHGVISPNTGDDKTNIQALKDYFDKNHDFYTGDGNFDSKKGVLSAKGSDGVPVGYEPYVFYFDSIRESQGLNYNSYKGYESYMTHKEDIVYSRFTKELAEVLQSEVLQYSQDEITELIKKVDPSIVIPENSLNVNNIPDIQTRHITQKTLKKFIEIFSKGTIGDFRKNVHNAGRYNGKGTQVGVDMVPYFVTLLDLINDEVLKNVGDDLESQIDTLVKNILSEDIKIATKYEDFTKMTQMGGLLGQEPIYTGSTYQNYYAGTEASEITQASQCSIYRGANIYGGKLTESNRGYNVFHSEPDVSYLNDLRSVDGEQDFSCLSNITNGQSLRGVWGGNSPLNFDTASSSGTLFDLKETNQQKSIISLFDIEGSREVDNIALIPSPLDCLNTNYLLQNKKDLVEGGYGDITELELETVYSIPTKEPYIGWSCNDFTASTGSTQSYDDILFRLQTQAPKKCEDTTLYLDGVETAKLQYVDNCSDIGCECDTGWDVHNYYFKNIPSILTHKSPDALTLLKQIKNGTTPDLPVDKNRYVDFIARGGEYKKIEYPFLFRVGQEGATYEKIKESVINILNMKSQEINSLITGDVALAFQQEKQEVGSVLGDLKELLGLESTQEGSIEDLLMKLQDLISIDATTGALQIDLVSYLQQKPDRVLQVAGEEKIISYFDTLVFAVYWNNLSSVSSKYSFVFKNYLSDDLGNTNAFFLPKNKKSYEIAYLGANGTAQDMFIKLDPENKNLNPYADIISENIDLNSYLFSGRGGDNALRNQDALFKCAPPDGVNLFEWIPAVFCWIGDMLPPTISISDSSCGVSLLSEEEEEYVKSCNGDINKNGVNDCLENNLADAQIDLFSDSEKYYYNQPILLSAQLKDSVGRNISYAHGTNVSFELSRINVAGDTTKPLSGNNFQTIFDAAKSNENSDVDIRKYINFTNANVPLKMGKAEYGLSAKGKDADIYVRAYIEIKDKDGVKKLYIDSSELKISIRGERLFSSSYFLDGSNVELGQKSLRASNTTNMYFIDENEIDVHQEKNSIHLLSNSSQKIILGLNNIGSTGNNQSLDYPLQIQVKKDDNTLKIIDLSESQKSQIIPVFSADVAGVYDILITDKNKFQTLQRITVLPALAQSVQLDIGTTVMESDGAVSTSLVTLLDKYNNPTSGELYTINLEILGEGLEFYQNQKKTLRLTTLEGYKAFRIRSNTEKNSTNILQVSIENAQGEILVRERQEIKTLQEINTFLRPQGNRAQVGGDLYEYELSFRDKDGNLLGDLNSRVYLSADRKIITPMQPYFEIKQGKAVLQFTTKNIAIENFSFDLQVEGLSSVISESLDILPGKPMKLSYILAQSKIEASENGSTVLQVEVKDRYNNTVFTDSSTQIDLSLHEKSQYIASADKNTIQVIKGKAQFRLDATDTPGTAYFKLDARPGFSQNSFDISGGNQTRTIYGVSSTAGKLETFYVWNHKKIEGTKYNALYTTLLGAEYGDITVENYLGGALLFDKNNRSLAVTSLLNKGILENNVVQIEKGGNIKTIYNPKDLSQDISLTPLIENGNLYINIFNSALSTYIGKLGFSFTDIDLETCDIKECSSSDATSMHLLSRSSDYEVFEEQENIVLKNMFGGNILEISNQGKLIKKGNISFVVDNNNSADFLLLHVYTGDEYIADLQIHLRNHNINISRNPDLFENTLQVTKDSTQLLLLTNSYGTKKDNAGIKISYKDPFLTGSSPDVFSREYIGSYESFYSQSGNGWSGNNKTLLEFAAGNSVGESTKNYMTPSLINLGDPVVSLKKIKQKLPNTLIDRKFDRTIGKGLSQDNNIVGYQVFDYNNDSLDDVLLVKDDNYLKILENNGGAQQLFDLGNLAHIADLGNKDLVLAGDFNGDQYSDIFFVDNKGKPFLLGNNKKDFQRIDLSPQLQLLGAVVRAKVYDMDADNIDDLVLLDDSGRINIFYGKRGNDTFAFDQVLLTDDYGILINQDNTNKNMLIYFDSLPFNNHDDISDPEIGVKNTINNIVYENIVYEVEKPDSFHLISETSSQEEVQDAIDSSQTALDELINTYGSHISYTGKYSHSEDRWFMRSEYAENIGLKMIKKIHDKNGDFIQLGDAIEVEIILQNTSGKTLKNIIFLEKVENILDIDLQSIQTSKAAVIKDGLGSYNFTVDNFSLDIDEEIKIRYTALAKPLSYGYLQVGDFEKNTLGSDMYGDVLLKKDNKNCATPVEMFASQGVRTYAKELKEPTCNNSVGANNLEENNLDSDGNNIPDYIDSLVNGTPEEIKEYGDQEQAKMNFDSDGDGIPDNEDSLDSSGNIYDVITDESFQTQANSALEGLENIMAGLSCGFGGGACYSTPLNWAPLAPGNDPVFMGRFIGDGLRVGEGIPIFSSLTGLQIYTPSGPKCIPSVFPATPLSYIPGPMCGLPGAGGYLGVTSPTNTVRVFVTPTITGAVGTAVCYGGPAIIAGNTMPKGLSPLVPGGNCIVAAKPILGCSNDGSEGNIASTGYSDVNASFDIINGNCSASTQYQRQRPELSHDFVKDYISNSYGGTSLAKGVQGAMVDHRISGGGQLFTLGEQGGLIEGGIEVSTDSGEGNFEDIIKINNKRPSDFPNFLMDWVTRQTEEIVNKLTDLPTIFIILPDFGGIFDSDWSKIKQGKYSELFNGDGNWREVSGNTDSSKVINLDPVLGETNIGESIENSTLKSLSRGVDTQKTKINKGIQRVNTSVENAYNYISNIPLVFITEEKVNVNIPWPDLSEIDAKIAEYKDKLEEYRNEFNEAKGSWTFGESCTFKKSDGTDDVQKNKECQDQNAVTEKISLDMDDTLRSLEQNIEILESYKNIPKDINDLLNTKEKYLEQLLCNVEAISEITGGWISRNGERFKAWIDAYILIKAILKSWQALIDIFIEYDAECRECKNERQDGLTSEFSLIGLLNIKIPIIQFPKWPDIELDLHNIRAGMNVSLPSFNINARPIVLPSLPDISFPKVPNINFKTPRIPLLPRLEIPDLPDLPGLPSIELPDLPPPPKLPKIFASLEGIIDILKLVTKAMCILKSSPFVPEWRAGDQIAFITERNGYLPFDFLNLSSPQFSFPWIDKIKVASYVDMELELDFLVELAEQSTKPINTFTNNAVNVFDIQVKDLDIGDYAPEDININIGEDNSVDIGYNGTSMMLAVQNKILNFINVLSQGKNDRVSLAEFRQIYSQSLMEAGVIGDPRFDRLVSILDQAQQTTFSKQDALIDELYKNNFEKFEMLKSILNTELIKNKQIQQELQYLDNSYLKPISKVDTSVPVDMYNTKLEKYNQSFIQSLSAFSKSNNNDLHVELKKEGEDLVDRVAGLGTTQTNYILSAIPSNSLPSNTNSCQNKTDSVGSYNYEGLYILENNVSYRLFDYLEELSGNEFTSIIDIENDGDEDVLYLMNQQLFLKQNLLIQNINQVSEKPLVLPVDKNKFFNGDVFYESINGLEEISQDSGIINFSFDSSTRPDVGNYRLEMYNTVDKFMHEERDSYISNDSRKTIYDLFSSMEDRTLINENEYFTLRNNLGYIHTLGNFRNIKVTTKELKNIKYDLENQKKVNLSIGTLLYAGSESFTLKYKEEFSDELRVMHVGKHKNIKLKTKLQVVGITGNAYINTGNDIEIQGDMLQSYIGMPIFPDFVAKNIGSIGVSDMSYLELRYFDETPVNIDFSKVSKYGVIDLGFKKKNHFVSLEFNNDYYYAHLLSMQGGIISNSSNQILLAPQIKSDRVAPEILLKDIRIPVYQETTIDITQDIYEGEGRGNISKVIVDLNLESDTNGDGNSKNDHDNQVEVIANSQFLQLKFQPFNEIFEKNIGLTVYDENGNNTYKQVRLQVYAPEPSIRNYDDGTILGDIDEVLQNEPIGIYRFRGGNINKIEEEAGNDIVYTQDGSYQFVPATRKEGGLTFYRNSQTGALINENTGKIDIVHQGYTVDVLSSSDKNNDKVFPKIILKQEKQPVFYEYISFPANKRIEIGSSLSDDMNTGIYVNFQDTKNYGFYVIPDTAIINPGALVIYRLTNVEKQPLFILFPDGRIKTWNKDYILRYNTKGEYIQLELYDSVFNRNIANVLLVPDADYILR